MELINEIKVDKKIYDVLKQELQQLDYDESLNFFIVKEYQDINELISDLINTKDITISDIFDLTKETDDLDEFISLLIIECITFCENGFEILSCENKFYKIM
jgi:hypothetical protein